MPASFAALRDGQVDMVAGSAHAPLWAFPRWEGSKVLCALSHGMYWFLVVRADLPIERGDLNGLKGLRLAAAPGVDTGLKAMLRAGGIDIEAEGIEIRLPPKGVPPGVSFGVAAAQALIDGEIDGFWANGMGAEVAITAGIAKCIIDVRRGNGPKSAFGFTQPALVTTAKLVEEQPEVAAGAVRAIAATHAALKEDITLATRIGEKLFPKKEADLIARLIERDLPYYSTVVSEEFVGTMNGFAAKAGLLEGGPVAYDDIVASQFRDLWA